MKQTIIKVLLLCRIDEPDKYIVEYDSGKCKQFDRCTKAINEFIDGREPVTRKYSNGRTISKVWE